MKKIFPLLLVIISASSFAQKVDRTLERMIKQDPELAATQLYTTGIQAKLSGDPVAALANFLKIIEFMPDHGAANYQVATIYPKDSYEFKTSDASRRAYLSDPQNIDYRDLYLVWLFTNSDCGGLRAILDPLIPTGNVSEENFYYAITCAARSGDMQAVDTLSTTFLSRWGYNQQVVQVVGSFKISRRVADGEAFFDQLVELYPQEYELFCMAANAKFAIDKPEQAVALLRGAIAIEPDNYRAPIKLAEYYESKGDSESFIEMISLAFSSAELDVEDKTTIFKETFVPSSDLVKNNPFDALRIANKMYASDPTNALIEKTYLDFLFELGESEACINLLTKQIEGHRDTPETYICLIEIEKYHKNIESVKRYIDMSKARFPSDYRIHLYEAINLTDPSEQLACYERAYPLAPSDTVRSEIKGYQGDVYHQLAQDSEAFKCYDKALKLMPTNVGVLNNYAYYLSISGKRLPDALRMIDLAIEVDGSSDTTLDTKAWILYVMGQYDEARTVQRRALALSSTLSPVLLLHYGDILYKLNDTFLAETYWLKARDAGASEIEVNERLLLIK